MRSEGAGFKVAGRRSTNTLLATAESKYGLGLPIATRPKENLIPFTRINYAGRPIYQIGISFFKVALLISYLRLFDRTNVQRAYRRVVLAAIALIFLSHLGCAFALIFACDPVSCPRRSYLPQRGD